MYIYHKYMYIYILFIYVYIHPYTYVYMYICIFIYNKYMCIYIYICIYDIHWIRLIHGTKLVPNWSRPSGKVTEVLVTVADVLVLASKGQKTGRDWPKNQLEMMDWSGLDRTWQCINSKVWASSFDLVIWLCLLQLVSWHVNLRVSRRAQSWTSLLMEEEDHHT